MRLALTFACSLALGGAATAQTLAPTTQGCTPYITGGFSLSLYPDHGTDQTTSVKIDASQTFQIVVGDFNDKTRAYINTRDDIAETGWTPILKNNSYLVTAKTISIRGVRGSPPPYQDQVGGKINVCILQ